MGRLGVYLGYADDLGYFDSRGGLNLASVGLVQELVFSKVEFGGSSQATWKLQVDPGFRSPYVVNNAAVLIMLGGHPIWAGRIVEIDPGDVFSFSASGLADVGGDMRAYDDTATAPSPYRMTNVLANISSRGAGWFTDKTRPVSSLTLSGYTDPNASVTGAEAMSKTADAQGLNWEVNPDGKVYTEPYVTTPQYILVNGQIPVGRAQSLFTYVYVLYKYSETTDANGNVKQDIRLLPYHNTPYIYQFQHVGPHEAYLDVTGLGVFTPTQASNAGKNWLAAKNQQAVFTDDIVVSQGQLLNVGGAPVDLATVEPNSVIRIIGNDSGRYTGYDTGKDFDIRISKVEYTESSEVLAITPASSVASDLVDSLV